MANTEIRSILAPLMEGHVLLPNSAVAEVQDYTRPEPLKQAPPWVLGELAWHGWQVPVICYEKLLKKSNTNPVTTKTRILVIKTLGESTQVNYIGLLIQGLPMLKKVSSESLVEIQTEGLPETLFSEVSIDDQRAMIPELANLTFTVEQAAYGS
jgi:chemosensory pili system protein ChpC